MAMNELILGQQQSAGRTLINLTQEKLARAAGLHVWSAIGQILRGWQSSFSYKGDRTGSSEDLDSS
jgi:hypothetical protein